MIKIQRLFKFESNILFSLLIFDQT